MSVVALVTTSETYPNAFLPLLMQTERIKARYVNMVLAYWGNPRMPGSCRHHRRHHYHHHHHHNHHHHHHHHYHHHHSHGNHHHFQHIYHHPVIIIVIVIVVVVIIIVIVAVIIISIIMNTINITKYRKLHHTVFVECNYLSTSLALSTYVFHGVNQGICCRHCRIMHTKSDQVAILYYVSHCNWHGNDLVWS